MSDFELSYPSHLKPSDRRWFVRLLFVSLAAAIILVGVKLSSSYQTAITTVGDHDISIHELSLALRESLWKQQLSWHDLALEKQQELRQQVLQQLIDFHLLHHQAMRSDHLDEKLIHQEAERRLQQNIKQFESTAVWEARASNQGLTEMTLRDLLIREVRVSHFIEAQLKEVTITEDELRHWFETHASKYLIPEMAHASHLFLTIHDTEKPNREKEIRSLHLRLLHGQDTMENLAAKHSEDPRTQKSAGDLGWFSRDRVPADFANHVFNLQINQLSAPFQTSLGWHIVRLHDKRSARPATFEECREEIRTRMEDLRRKERLEEFLKTLRQQHPVTIHSYHLSKVTPAQT